MTAWPQPLRAAVIGCGAISQHHLAYLAQSPHATLVALCDRSPALAAAAAARYGRVPTFDDTAQMFGQSQIDVVHVLTPPASHPDLVRAGLAAGCHVICEKPMTGTTRQTAELLKVAQVAGRQLIESRNLQFCDTVVAIKNAVDQGRLGDLRECDILLQVDFLAGPFGDLNLSGAGVDLPAGAVHDFLPHLAYLFQHLTDTRDAARVDGRLQNLSRNRRAGFDFLDALVVADDRRGRLRICADVGPAAFKVALRGTEGTIETDLYNPFLGYAGPPDIGKRAPFGQMRAGLHLFATGLRNLHRKIAQKGADYGIHAMLDATYQSLRTNKPSPIGQEDILATARLVDQLVALRGA